MSIIYPLSTSFPRCPTVSVVVVVVVVVVIVIVIVIVVVVVSGLSKRRMIMTYVVLCCLTVAKFVFPTLGPFFSLCHVIS